MLLLIKPALLLSPVCRIRSQHLGIDISRTVQVELANTGIYRSIFHAQCRSNWPTQAYTGLYFTHSAGRIGQHRHIQVYISRTVQVELASTGIYRSIFHAQCRSNWPTQAYTDLYFTHSAGRIANTGIYRSIFHAQCRSNWPTQAYTDLYFTHSAGRIGQHRHIQIYISRTVQVELANTGIYRSIFHAQCRSNWPTQAYTDLYFTRYTSGTQTAMSVLFTQHVQK